MYKGNDVGEQYRSAIFYRDNSQQEIAEKVKEEIEKSGMYKDPKLYRGFKEYVRK